MSELNKALADILEIRARIAAGTAVSPAMARWRWWSPA